MTTLRTVTPAPSVASTENEVIYQMVKRAEINPMEVEDLTRTAIEVTVLWNRSALHVAHLDDDRGFALTSVAPSLPSPSKHMVPALGVGGAVMIGGAIAASLGVASLGALATVVGVGLGVRRHQQNEAVRQDGGRFVVDAEMLGADELPVVMREGAGARFVFAAGASGDVEIDGEKRSLADLTAQGLARPSSVVEGAFEVAMVPGGRYRMELNGLTVVAKAVRAGRRALVSTGRDRSLRGASIGAAAAVAALLGMMRFAAHDDAGMLSDRDHDDAMAELRDFLAHHTEQAEPPTPRARARRRPTAAARTARPTRAQRAMGSPPHGEHPPALRDPPHGRAAAPDQPDGARAGGQPRRVRGDGRHARRWPPTASSGIVTPFG